MIIFLNNLYLLIWIQHSSLANTVFALGPSNSVMRGLWCTDQGPVVQSVVSLTSSLVVKILTVLVSTISNLQVFLLKKNVTQFFQQKY